MRKVSSLRKTLPESTARLFPEYERGRQCVLRVGEARRQVGCLRSFAHLCLSPMSIAYPHKPTKADLLAARGKTVRWYVENEWWWRKSKSREYLEYYRKWYGQRLAGAK
jgi:hypothetical protein